jgi:putative ATP-dependent endonuclease of OLD family
LDVWRLSFSRQSLKGTFLKSMDLVSFSVSNYRSITKANKLPIGNLTVLVGPNNEGKSNILRALVVTLNMLRHIGSGFPKLGRWRPRLQKRREGYYDWEQDFPISLQEKEPDGKSVFSLELRLSPEEVSEFETEVESSINGTLPVEISLGPIETQFRVVKKGKGGKALSKKKGEISQFISKRINVSYIPAVRTAQSAHQIVDELVEKELAVVESDSMYQKALDEIGKIQKPVLDKISGNIRETLKEFLPNVTEVTVTVSQEERFQALRQCKIIVDDGTPTQLNLKGDGVQSLAAISLMRHASEDSGAGRNLILAIEEPESHLHPKAIHQLRSVISEIARKHQVIMTTHCPLFVDRMSLRSNIIVEKNKATPAHSIREIREKLGVRVADNLQHAELMLLVEGDDDKLTLTALLKHYSNSISDAIEQQFLGIESLHGGSNLSYMLGRVQEAMCSWHVFLDNDSCGVSAMEKAEKEGLLISADCTLANCIGKKESELEDMIDVGLYSDLLQRQYGVSHMSPQFKGREKWSDRVKKVFSANGKLWNDLVEMKLKKELSELVKEKPGDALNKMQRSAFDALVRALEEKLAAISKSSSGRQGPGGESNSLSLAEPANNKGRLSDGKRDISDQFENLKS